MCPCATDGAATATIYLTGWQVSVAKADIYISLFCQKIKSFSKRSSTCLLAAISKNNHNCYNDRVKIYNLDKDEALKKLETTEAGLTTSEVKRRLKLYGSNTVKVRGTPLWKKIINPFANIMIGVLIVAVIISYFQGEKFDAIIIFSIIMVSAVIDWVQTFSTERILRSLRHREAQAVSVMRDDQTVDVSVANLVPGDIIHIIEGEKIPADSRIIQSDGLSVDESMLTGESLSVAKSAARITGNKEVYDQKNMLFSGSFVVSGTATVLVTATGNNTEFGELAKLTASGAATSPVQRKISKLLRVIIITTFIAAVMALGLAILRGIGLAEAFRFVLALSVSAVPEGLPVAITVVLVLGMRRMAKKKALVRNMKAIENIGEVTVIATDKTGTLTKNQLSVQSFWAPSGEQNKTTFALILSHTVNLVRGTKRDPLDVALHEYVRASKIELSDKMVASLPFDYSYAMSGNVWQMGQKYEAFVKGAPEKVLARSNISDKVRKQASAKLQEMAARGERVIAIAKCPATEATTKLAQLKSTKLQFLGLVSVADTLRTSSMPAITQAKTAGIDVKMVTGDHAETAYQIAHELKLADTHDQVFDASQLGNSKLMPATVESAKVFARIIPETKFKILDVLRKSNITAMTGDGANDVPALAKADIGIAMGSGSQIAKEASDIVLLDDNFRTVITGVREGRIIIDNIKRMLVYLLSTNAGEVLVSIGALLVGMPLPLVAVQILWINLVTDTTMVIPLGLENGEKDIMRRPPRDPKSSMINRYMAERIVLIAVLIAILTLVPFWWFERTNGLDYGRTVAFSMLVVLQWASAFSMRSLTTSIFRRGPRNRKLFIAFLISVALQVLVIYSPVGEHLFHTQAVDWARLLAICGFGAAVLIVAIEIHKWIGRRNDSIFG